MQKYKRVTMLRALFLLLGVLLPTCIFAQQIKVQGVVKDQAGESVIGASILQKEPPMERLPISVVSFH